MFGQKLALFLTGLTVFIFAVYMSGSPVFELPKGILEWRYLLTFYSLSCVVIFSCTFMDGVNNKRTSAFLAIGLLIDNILFYLMWSYGHKYGLYFVMWSGMISVIPLYILLQYNLFISLYILSIAHKITLIRSSVEVVADAISPTRFEIEIVKPVKFMILVEFTYSFISFLYAALMGLSSNDSITETIIAHGHFEYYYVSLIADDVTIFILLALIISNVLRDNAQPDTL